MVMPSAIPNNMVMKWDNCAKNLNVISCSLYNNLFKEDTPASKEKHFLF